MYDVILRSALVVDPINHIEEVMDVAFEAGKIAEVSPSIVSKASSEYDFTGYVVQPGIIDTHVHLGKMWGSCYGHRMLALAGVTTALDMAGPIEEIFEHIDEYGAGLKVGILNYASPGFTLSGINPSNEEIIKVIDSALNAGALGVKVLGGPFPMSLDASIRVIEQAIKAKAYAAIHAGSTTHGSNIEGVRELFETLGNTPYHLAHANAYCRGAIAPDVEETKELIGLLKLNPLVTSESYVSDKNGVSLKCDASGTVISQITKNCLKRFGFAENTDGVKAALLAQKVWAIFDSGQSSELITGKEALDYWQSKNTDTGGCFSVNPPLPRLWLSHAKRDDGTFVVDAISTDGGCFPRNVIVSNGLSLVKLGILSLKEFVVKTSVNPARLLRIEASKGHLSPGADADVTVFDFASQRPIAAFVDGTPIMLNGRLLGKRAKIFCKPQGLNAVKERGLSGTAIDIERPYKRTVV